MKPRMMGTKVCGAIGGVLALVVAALLVLGDQGQFVHKGLAGIVVGGCFIVGYIYDMLFGHALELLESKVWCRCKHRVGRGSIDAI